MSKVDQKAEQAALCEDERTEGTEGTEEDRNCFVSSCFAMLQTLESCALGSFAPKCKAWQGLAQEPLKRNDFKTDGKDSNKTQTDRLEEMLEGFDCIEMICDVCGIRIDVKEGGSWSGAAAI